MKNKFKFLNVLSLAIVLFVPLVFLGCENSNKNTLATPSIFAINGGVIVFSPVENAEYYTLAINDMEINLDVKYNKHVEIIDNRINYDASKILEIGENYSIKIKANAQEKTSSAYSQAFSYKHLGAIKQPTNLKINGTTLTWDVIENASYYIVKVLTPADTVVFDKNDNILDSVDSGNIANADVTEYTFSNNKFDFSSLLTNAGKYHFFVCAVTSDNVLYIESPYTSKVSYSHKLELATPINQSVYKIFNNETNSDEYYLSSIIDEKANGISITCNGREKIVEINQPNQGINFESSNYLNINLNTYFQEYILRNELDLNAQTLVISTKSVYISSSDSAYYENSASSKNVVFENQSKLPTPTLTLNKNNILSWAIESSSDVIGYKLLVLTETGVTEYPQEKEVYSMNFDSNFIGATIQSVGLANNVSNFSDMIYPANSQISTFNLYQNNNTVQWTNVNADYYFVQINNKYFTTTETSYTFSNSDFINNKCNISVYAIKNGYEPICSSLECSQIKKLNAPTFTASQGFNGPNLYELTFTGSEHAIGYYVYIKSITVDEFVKIDKLYTSTSINLSSYICNEGEFTDYQVKVQAVSAIDSGIEYSDLSTAVSVSHIQILENPKFFKTGHVETPVIKEVSGNSINYYLQFYGVSNADNYEILINFNKKAIEADTSNPTKLYKVDISTYLRSANKYEIKIRALPSTSASNIQASEYSVATYNLTKQLPMVENIQIHENDNIYTLSFNPVDNAQKYRVRIIKENDPNYIDYLKGIGLSNTFDTAQSCDVTKYVKQQGVYYFHITAIAPQNSYYANSNESSTYGLVSKLTSLECPSNITFNNISSSNYTVSWIGDSNADYYLIKITDPRHQTYEIKEFNSTSTNINQYITIQGNYLISIYSMVNTATESATQYNSSSATDADLYYIYSAHHDFVRYAVSIYGTSTTFAVTNIDNLKNLLWYHYLYEIDFNTGLNLRLAPQLKEDRSEETMREMIVRLAEEANNSQIYPFLSDEQWEDLQSSGTDNDLFGYLCEKVLCAYPEFNILSNFALEHQNGSLIFNLKYKNALDNEKVEYDQYNVFTNTNYGNNYKYIDLYSRKSSTGAFKIDSRSEEFVTTTEQLLQVVQHNKKPKFVGESSTAETVYANAKLVLSAIISNNMTDLEKVTAIFDWLEYGFDVTYYTVSSSPKISGSIESNNLAIYGKYKHYYLEGIFEKISMQPNGNIVISNNLATSWSYSKAFALLCAIEGINASVVNGSYTYTQGSGHTATTISVNHVWNKVLLDTSADQNGSKKWFNIDLTFSDNRIAFNNLTGGYGISSHSYFLTTDTYAELNLNLIDKTHIISNEYKLSRKCNTYYDYYKDSRFGLTYNQIDNTILDFDYDSADSGFETDVTDFNYAKKYNSSTEYQKYGKTLGYGKMQSFLLNALIYAKHSADANSSRKSVFEFQFNWSENSGSNVFNVQTLQDVLGFVKSNYSLSVNLMSDVNGENSIYTVEDSSKQTTTVIFIVSKSA